MGFLDLIFPFFLAIAMTFFILLLMVWDITVLMLLLKFAEITSLFQKVPMVYK